jgi:hypothetical protein
MALYLIIENENKFYLQIESAIKSVDSSATLQHFENFELYKKKCEDEQSQSQGETTSKVLFDMAVVNLSDSKMAEWADISNFIKTTLKPEAPACLISFDNEIPTLLEFKKMGFYNIIHKPFDELILKETLAMALQNKKIYTAKEIKSQKNTAIAGILKDVELQSISELGFLTLSESPLPLLSLSKYFSPIFDTEKKQSIWAQCLASVPHPQKSGFFINKFQFYYTSREVLNQIRKKVQSLKSHETSNALWNLSTVPKDSKIFKIALIARQTKETEIFQQELISHFKYLEVDFLDIALNHKKPEQILDYDIALNLTNLEVEQIKFFFSEKTKYFWFPQNALDEDSLKEHCKFYLEIFTTPYDKSYFYKKLKSLIPDLILIETPSLLNVSCHEIIKAANFIEVLDMNEVFISFNYPRELDFDTARNFILLNKNSEMSVEIPGFCHFKEKCKVQKNPEKNDFFHQFAFYSVTNEALTEIRKWLLHNYIQKNQKDSN